MMGRHSRARTITILASVTVCGMAACRVSESTGPPQRTVTVYVSTDRVFSEPVLRDYERRFGVKVNAAYDTEETKSTGLANRLLAEQARPQADVFWSNEPVRTLVLKSRGVLAPYRSPSAEGIPPELVDLDGYLSSSIRTDTGRDSPRASGSSPTTPGW
jgi:ABC-type thiamine transport system substrate-binding protein